MISRKFLSLFFMFFILTNQVYGGYEALERIEEVDLCSSEKIYINPENIYVSCEGIFFMDATGIWQTTNAIFSDANGIYIMAFAYQCPACGRWNKNNVCGNRQCPMFGK